MADPVLDDPSVPTFEEDPAQWQAPVEAPSVQDLLDQGYTKGLITQAPNFSQQDFLDAGYQLGTIAQPPIDFVQAHDHLWNEFTGDEFLSSHPGLPAIDGSSSRGFDGDKSIKDMTAQIGQSYEDLMKQAGAPQEDIDKGRKYIEAAVGRRAKELALQTLANNQPRSWIDDPLWEKQPLFGDIRRRVREKQTADAWNNIRTGNGETRDYLQAASDLRYQSEQANRGTGAKVGEALLGAGKTISEIGMLSPAAKALGAGTGSTFIGRAAATGFGYTAAQFPLTGMQDLLDGKPLSDVAKEEAGQFIDNSILMGFGGLGQYASMPQGAIRKGGALLFDALKLVGSADVSEDTKKMIGLSHEAGPITRMLGAAIEKDPKKLADAFADLWQNQGALVAINAAMHVIQQGHRGDPKALAEKLIAQEMLPKEVMPPERRSVPSQPADIGQAPAPARQASAEPPAPASPNEYVQTDKGWFSRREAEAQGLLPKAGGAEPAATPSPAQPPPPEPRKPLADFSDDDVRGLAKQFGLDARGSRETLLKRLNDMDKGRTVASLESLSAPPAKVAEAPGPPTIAQEPRAQEPAQAPAPAPERRQDVERRRAVAEMSPEEMRKELLTNPVTGLPNRRAFDEAGPAKAVGMSDADGLKALNDKFGYEAGDTMLRAKAEALKEAGLDAYHEKGDEFLYRGGSKEELGQKLERARSILRDKIIHTEKAGDFKGADFSYGHGADRAEAETGLKAHKAQREAAGERARGELRGITQVGAEPGGENLGRAAPGDHGETPAPRAPVGPHPLEPHIRNALTRDEVGTSKEIWQDVNQQRQKKGLAKAPFAQVREALDRMKGRGDIIEHPGAEGDDPIHTLTGQEGEATPEAVEKAKRELKESINADIANRQRNGGEPASVRRALNGDLQKATPLARSAIAREEAAAGQASRTAGVPEVSHTAGAAAERPESAAGGGSPASSDIVAKAQELRSLDRDDVADHNAILRDVWRRLKAEGIEPRDYKRRFEDASKVPGLDEAAGYWAEKRPDKLVKPGQEPGDVLHSMLREGMRKPMSSQESLEKAEDYLRSQANPEEHANAQQEGRLAGYSAEAVRQHVARIEAEVRAEAEAEERAEKEREREQAETAAERAAIQHEPGAGEPAGREPWDLIAGESGAVNLKALAKFFGFKEEEPTGIANAMAAKERQKARLPPVQQPSPVGHSYPELRDQVLQIARTDPTRIDRLVEELQKKSRPVTDLEDALLLHRQNDIRNQYGDSLHKLIQAQAGGDAADLQGAQATERDARERLRDITDVTKQVGTESARGLAARKMMVNQDFSLANMLMQSEAAKGRPLTAEEKADLVRQQHNIADTEGKRVAAESALAQEGGGAKSPLFPEMQKAQVAAEEAKDAWRRSVQADRDANRPLGQRMEDFLTKLRRAMVISSPTTMAKIIAASAERIAISPMEEAVGAMLAKLPGISKIAAMAPREGRGLNFDAEKRAFAGAFTDGMKDAWKTAKEGHSELDTLYGDTSHPRSWLDLVGEFHAAGKAPAVRDEFTRSFLKRIDAEAAQGKDTTSPAALTRLGLEAYKDSQAAKFQQQNWLADGIKRFLRPAPNASAGERAAKFAGRMILPVVTVPTNLVFEASRYAFGTATGSAQAGLALARGVENLKPAEADNIMQQLKKGSLGLAALALGYYAPKAIGGFYSGKRKPDDVEAGAIGSVPGYVLHNPLLEILQMGSTVRRVSDKQGWGEGVAKSVLGLGEQIPLVREATDVGGKALSMNPKVRGQYFGDLAKSLAVPQLVQWLAGRLDTKETATSYANPLTGEVQKRRPVGVLQHVQEGVPGLRNLLPKR